jgi:tripartite-type tricarboxylate transporter receptor subunit TctC
VRHRLARAFQPYLQEELGQPLVIVNRPGAGALQINAVAAETAQSSIARKVPGRPAAIGAVRPGKITVPRRGRTGKVCR